MGNTNEIMNSEANKFPSGDGNLKRNEFDYIIVGLGAAGTVLAARLAEDQDLKIAVIEAGGDYTSNPNVSTPAKHVLLWDSPVYRPPFDPDYDEWSFKTESKSGEYVYPRGTGNGGCTNHNSLVMLRGSRKPYDLWADLSKDESWNYDNLLPYFKKLENNNNREESEFRGQSGWLQVSKFQPEGIEIDIVKAARDMEIPYINDTNGDPSNIAGVSQWDNSINRKTGQRSYAVVDLLFPIMEKNKNVVIFNHSLASKIIFDENKTAIGVEFLQGKYNYGASIQYEEPSDKSYKIYAKNEVILCGGAFNSPQLLMLSGIGPRQHLESFGIPVISDLPVGNHLLDHLEVTVINEVNTIYSKHSCPGNNLPFAKEDEDDACIEIYKSSGLGPYSAGGHSLGIDWFTGLEDHDLSSPEIHIGSFCDYFKDFDLKNWFGIEQNPLKTYHTFLIEITQPEAQSGTVRLRSKNPYDPPIINQRLDNDRDLTILAGGIEFVRKLFANSHLSKYSPVEVRPGPDYETNEDLRRFIFENSLFGHHCSGSVKFGHKDDPSAVLDSKLCVKGVKKLRVIDASIFPTIVSYNPNLPIYCIAEKMSDEIKKAHKRSEIKESWDVPKFQDVHESQDGQKLQGEQKLQGGQKLQDGQKLQGGQKLKGEQKLQGGQKLQDAQKSRNVQDSRDAHESHDVHESRVAQELKDVQKVNLVKNVTSEARTAFISYLDKHGKASKHEINEHGITDIKNNLTEFFNKELKEPFHKEILYDVIKNNGIMTLTMMLSWIEENYYQLAIKSKTNKLF